MMGGPLKCKDAYCSHQARLWLGCCRFIGKVIVEVVDGTNSADKVLIASKNNLVDVIDGIDAWCK